MQGLDSLETDSSLIGIEVFSGMHRLSTEFRNLVGDFETFEIHDTSDENILLKRGILNLFRKLLRVIKDGIVWFGVPCQSWIILSRSWTERSILIPESPERRFTTQKQWQYLETHNKIADTVAMFIRTCKAFCINFVIEQPMSSLLFHYSSIEEQVRGLSRVTFCMDDFCGKTPKPLALVGDAPLLTTFKKVVQLRKGIGRANDRLTVRKTGTTGSSNFTGQRQKLKESSGYTYSFGVAIASCFMGLTEEQVVSQMRGLGVA